MGKTYDRVKVLVNPSSVNNPDATVQQLTDQLGSQGIEPETMIPSSPDDMAEEAQRCARESYDLVIGVGGDGTINLILNALAQSQTALAVVPLGTANALARQLGMPSDIALACKAITKGTKTRIDLGRVNGRYFGCTSGVGFDAEVIKDADKRIKRVSGYAAYLLSGIRGLMRGPTPSVRIKLDNDAEELRGYMVLVNNGQYYGGDFVFAPNARMDDGILDIILFQRRDPGSVLRYAASLSSGTIVQDDGVVYRRARRVEVQRHGRHAIHVDGEYIGRTPAEYTIAPLALDIVFAPGAS